MFAPNTKPFFHHRDHFFHRLFLETERAFLELAGLPEKDWTVLFLTGSGTLGLEAVLWSATRPVSTLFVEGKEFEFGLRLTDLAFTHEKYGIGCEDVAYVQYDTACSILNISGWKAKGVTIVDAVSSFPYHPIPEDADVVVTVSGKQLGAPPGIAIVAVHNRVWEDGFFDPKNETNTYLNLNRYRKYRGLRETPNTPAITVLYDLWQSLAGFDREGLIQRVNYRYSALTEVVGNLSYLSPPVFTFKERLPCHEALGLYGKTRTQLFLWDQTPGSDNDFDLLLNELRRLKNEGAVSAFWGD